MNKIKLNWFSRFIAVGFICSVFLSSVLSVNGEKNNNASKKKSKSAESVVKQVVNKKKSLINVGKKTVVPKKNITKNNSKDNENGLKIIEKIESEKLNNRVEEIRNIDVGITQKKQVVATVENLIDNSILAKYAVIVSENGVSLESVFARLIIAYGILAAYAIEGVNKKDNKDVLSLQVDKNKLNHVLDFNKQLIVNTPSLSRSEILQVSSKFSDIVSIIVAKINPHDNRSDNKVNRMFHAFCNDFASLFPHKTREDLKMTVYEMIKTMKAENNGELHFDIKKNINMMLYKMMLTFLSCPEYTSSEDSQRTRLLLALSSILFKSTLMINGINKNITLKTLPKESFSYKKWAVGISVSLFVIGGMAYLTNLYQWHKVDDDAPTWRKNLASMAGVFHKVWEGMAGIKNIATNKYDALRTWITGKKAASQQQQASNNQTAADLTQQDIQTKTNTDSNGQDVNQTTSSTDFGVQDDNTQVQNNNDQQVQQDIQTQTSTDQTQQQVQQDIQAQTNNDQTTQQDTQTQTSTDLGVKADNTQAQTNNAQQDTQTQTSTDQTQQPVQQPVQVQTNDQNQQDIQTQTSTDQPGQSANQTQTSADPVGQGIDTQAQVDNQHQYVDYEPSPLIYEPQKDEEKDDIRSSKFGTVPDVLQTVFIETPKNLWQKAREDKEELKADDKRFGSVSDTLKTVFIETPKKLLRNDDHVSIDTQNKTTTEVANDNPLLKKQNELAEFDKEQIKLENEMELKNATAKLTKNYEAIKNWLLNKIY